MACFFGLLGVPGYYFCSIVGPLIFGGLQGPSPKLSLHGDPGALRLLRQRQRERPSPDAVGCGDLPGKPVAHNSGLLWLNYGLFSVNYGLL